MSECNCKFCQAYCEWKFDVIRGKNRLFDLGKLDWHNCQTEPKEEQLPDPVLWYCWGCGRKIDICNHPCFHYNSMPKDERAIVWLNMSKDWKSPQTKNYNTSSGYYKKNNL